MIGHGCLETIRASTGLAVHSSPLQRTKTFSQNYLQGLRLPPATLTLLSCLLPFIKRIVHNSAPLTWTHHPSTTRPSPAPTSPTPFLSIVFFLRFIVTFFLFPSLFCNSFAFDGCWLIPFEIEQKNIQEIKLGTTCMKLPD